MNVREQGAADRAATLECVDDLDEINRLYRERRWSDGLPIVPPTVERVERMLQHTKRSPDELVARVSPLIKTGMSVGATRRRRCKTSFSADDCPTIPSAGSHDSSSVLAAAGAIAAAAEKLMI